MVYLVHNCAYQRLSVTVNMVPGKWQVVVSLSAFFGTLRECGLPCHKRRGADDDPISRVSVPVSKSKQTLIA